MRLLVTLTSPKILSETLSNVDIATGVVSKKEVLIE